MKFESKNAFFLKAVILNLNYINSFFLFFLGFSKVLNFLKYEEGSNLKILSCNLSYFYFRVFYKVILGIYLYGSSLSKLITIKNLLLKLIKEKIK